MSRHTELVARYWGAPVPGHLQHGPNRYASRVYGCDCKLCLPSGRRRGEGTTHRERQRKLKATKRGKPVPEGTKHGVYAYQTYGCRCDVCREAKNAARRRQRDPWSPKTHGHYHEDVERGVTVIHWPPRELDGPWLCPTCGEFKVLP